MRHALRLGNATLNVLSGVPVIGAIVVRSFRRPCRRTSPTRMPRVRHQLGTIARRPGPASREIGPFRAQNDGVPGRIRTCDRRFRRPLLYPLSYGDSGDKDTQRSRARLARPMADDRIITKVQLQRPQIDSDRELLRDEDLLNEEHLRRMDQVLLRRNLDHVRMFSRKLSLELQQYVHLYTPEANELRRRIEKYMVMERLVEREMARRHTY